MRGILAIIILILIFWALFYFANIPFKLYKSFKSNSEEMNKQYEQEEEQHRDDK